MSDQDPRNRPDSAVTALLEGVRVVGTGSEEIRNFFTPTPSTVSSLYPTFGTEHGVVSDDAEKTLDVIELRPGTMVAHYELIRELGRGGMGHVFLARDTKLGRRVAIKFIATTSPTLSARFIAEARATAQCTHENIVIIHEVDTHQSLPYMVLEYLEGKTIKHSMKGRRLSVARALDIIVPVLRALVRAHANGIVHRDLKPDNIFLTNAGQVKVLDFGLVKVLADGVQPGGPGGPVNFAALSLAGGSMPGDGHSGEHRPTQDGVFVGTPPYMSPEQLGVGNVDKRTDIWAVGILLYRMLAGRHPLDKLTDRLLWENAQDLTTPMPSLAQHAPHVDRGLIAIVDRCLEKVADRRWPTAQSLLDAIGALAPGQSRSRLSMGECPYPGLHPFQETDAGRFFGRNREIAQVVARLRQQPILGVVGPSGVGKSSLVRAGVVPALKASGDDWTVRTIRPGRTPMLTLATLIAEDGSPPEHVERIAAYLRECPGYLGQQLRERARHSRQPMMLFVDQFEELYTQGENTADRLAFTACLRGVGDDVTAPLRVIISMRSDFLDRVSEDRYFADELTSGLVLLSSPDREGLREALVAPLAMTSYSFEDPEIVEGMLSELEASPGALPLLQFAAARLWDLRDQERRLLTKISYMDIGGVAGALASHADEVLTTLGSSLLPLIRALFQRLVTPERTRAIVDVSELEGLSPVPGQVQRLLARLVSSRLLVIQNRGDGGGPAAEIVHESLITRWPTLAKWLDENEGDVAFLDQLRSTAKRWEERGRPPGLVWRGQAAAEARWWKERSDSPLSLREQAYLDAVLSLATRSSRRRRIAVAVVMIALGGIAVGASIAMLAVSDAKQTATEAAERAKVDADRAKDAEGKARRETVRAQAAEQDVKRQLALIKEAQDAKQEATTAAAAANEEAAESREELAQANKRLRKVAAKAERAKTDAQKAAARAEREAEKNKKLLAKEQARVKKLKAEMAKISKRLK